MAIAVASSSSVGFSASSATITKPTGLAVGDLMIACIFSSYNDADVAVATLSGWTSIVHPAGGQGTSMQYKIADAGDVAASNFVFTDDQAASRMAGVILRCTGHITAPLDTSAGVNGANQSTATPSFSCSLTPDFDGSLLVMAVHGFNTNTDTTTISSYAINGTNPTWTEYLDESTSAILKDPIAGVAAAVQTTSAAITSFTATISASKEDFQGILAVFTPVIDVNSSVSPVGLVAAVQDPTSVTGGSEFAATQVSLTAAIQAPTVSTPAETWTDQSKSSSTWTEQPKS